MINPQYSHLGVSPDGITECRCCGKRVLEVKCPYRCKDLTIKELSKDTSFCLESLSDDTFSLQLDHNYYYQVQLQMKICEVNICHFVVWSPKELVILEVEYNFNFLETALTKAYDFFKFGVMPELVSKLYSSMKMLIQELLLMRQMVNGVTVEEVLQITMGK